MVLPARAGMSPVCLSIPARIHSAPRTGGDEPPDLYRAGDLLSCSPHGRG